MATHPLWIPNTPYDNPLYKMELTDIPPHQLIRPFGPSVLHSTLPESIRKETSELVDEILLNPLNRKILDNSFALAGQVDTEVRLPLQDKRAKPLIEYILKLCEHYHDQETNHLGKDPKDGYRFEILTLWAVRQLERDWNPRHFHAGVLSGVIYLKIPEKMMNVRPQKSVHPGQIEFFDGSPAHYRMSIYRRLPKVGDFFVFPAWLEHVVSPFYGEGERVSLSFNVDLVPVS